MTATGALIIKSRLPASQQKLLKRHLLKPLQDINNPMSKALVRELDLKMQQVREYTLITHGYHNENFQYPVHVRRSHDGEKVSRTSSVLSQRKKPRSIDSTILTSSSHENHTKSKAKDSTSRHFSYDEGHVTLNIPPNKTINDIHPHRNSSLSSTNSSPILCSTRPHSIAGSSLPSNDEQQINSLSDSSQSLLNQSPPPTKTLTQRFFSKFFHSPSKS